MAGFQCGGLIEAGDNCTKCPRKLAVWRGFSRLEPRALHATLKQRSTNTAIFDSSQHMESSPTTSYLRTYRRRSGLSQRELADVLGLITEKRVSEHERSITVPLFLTAISYEIVFNVPISKLLPGIYETVRGNVESRLTELETQLQESNANGRAAIPIARKLEWICERKSLTRAESVG